MAIELHLWVKSNPAAGSWVQLVHSLIVNLANEHDFIIQRAAVHFRPSKFCGKDAARLMKAISINAGINKLHVLVLTNDDVSYGKINNQYRISYCLADKVMLANSISRVIGNSRILVLDLLNPATAPVAKFEAIKSEIVNSTLISRSNAYVADFTQLNHDGSDHCVNSSSRHMCQPCIDLSRRYLQEVIYTMITTVRASAIED
jgi:hypothetical protein